MPETQQAVDPASATSPAISDGGEGAALTDEQILGLPEIGAPVEETKPAEAAEQAPVEAVTQQDAEAGESEQPLSAAPPAWFKALFADPKVGREAQRLWDRAVAYQNVFATPAEASQMKELFPGGLEEAREIAARAQSVVETDEKFFSGDPQAQAEVLADMYGEAPEAFVGAIPVALEVIRQRNPEAFQQSSDQVLQHLLGPEKFSEYVEAVRQVVVSGDMEHLQALANELVGWADKRGLTGKQPELDPRQQAFQRREQAFQQREQAFRKEQLESFVRGADESIRPMIGRDIAAALTQLIPKAAPLIRSRIEKEISSQIDETLKADKELARRWTSLVNPAGNTYRFDKKTQEQVVNLMYGSAKRLLPGVAKRVIGEWTQASLAAQRAKQEKQSQAASRVDIVGGAPPGSSGKPPLTPERIREIGQKQGRPMSDEEILSY